MRRLHVLALALAMLAPGSLAWSEETATPATPVTPATPAIDPAGAGKTGAAAPLEIAPEALPEGLVVAAKKESALRRFEIVAFGAFPITLFYTNFGFDLARFAANGFDASYAPWPISGSASTIMTDEERLWRFGAGALSALVVAGIDAVLQASRARRSARPRRPVVRRRPNLTAGIAHTSMDKRLRQP